MHSWVSFLFWPSHFIFLKLLVIALYSSPVAYRTFSHLGRSSPGVISFCLFILFMFMGSHGWNTGMVCLSLLQWTFCQNSSPSPIWRLWPCTAWLIASLNYASPFAMTRLWSMKGIHEFNSDDHYIYYSRQESLRRNGVALIVNKRSWNAVLGAISKTAESSQFVSKANHSTS